MYIIDTAPSPQIQDCWMLHALYYVFPLSQSIPKITALSPEATAVPLVCVLAATGVKDAADDIVS